MRTLYLLPKLPAKLLVTAKSLRWFCEANVIWQGYAITNFILVNL